MDQAIWMTLKQNGGDDYDDNNNNKDGDDDDGGGGCGGGGGGGDDDDDDEFETVTRQQQHVTFHRAWRSNVGQATNINYEVSRTLKMSLADFPITENTFFEYFICQAASFSFKRLIGIS